MVPYDKKCRNAQTHVFLCCLVGCMHDLWSTCHWANNLDTAFKLYSLQLLVYMTLVESPLDVISSSTQIKISSYLFFGITLSSTKCTLFLSIVIGLILVVINTYLTVFIYFFLWSQRDWVIQCQIKELSIWKITFLFKNASKVNFFKSRKQAFIACLS